MSQELMMRGWLHKKKSKSSVVGSDANRRWFVIEKVTSNMELNGLEEKIEFALSYYKNPKSMLKCGWFFLSDVRTILTDDVSRWITIHLPTRTYQLRTPDHRQHDAWCHSLETLCSNSTRPRLFGKCTAARPSPNASLLVPLVNTGLPTNPCKEDTSTKEEDIRNQLEFLRAINKDPLVPRPPIIEITHACDERKSNPRDGATEAKEISGYNKLDTSEQDPNLGYPAETMNAAIGAKLDGNNFVDYTNGNSYEVKSQLVYKPGCWSETSAYLQGQQRSVHQDHDVNEFGTVLLESYDENYRQPKEQKSWTQQISSSENNIKILSHFNHHQHIINNDCKSVHIRAQEYENSSDCSFLPDDDFVNEKWDSSSSDDNEDDYNCNYYE